MTIVGKVGTYNCNKFPLEKLKEIYNVHIKPAIYL